MTIPQTALLDAIEMSLHIIPTLPGKIEPLSLHNADGRVEVRGRVTSVSHPVANMVGAAQLTPATADAAIAAVRGHFAAQSKAFGWVTGPRSTPADMGARLLAAGFAKIEEMAGMCLTDLNAPITTSPDVSIVEATPDRWLGAAAMMAEAYGLPVDVAELFAEAFSSGGSPINSLGYLAYLRGSDLPIAYSNLVFIPDTNIVLLGGAATMPVARGQGVYRSMVARRLQDARARGAEAAVIQAVRPTSAPICADLGFREICGLEMYAWSPAAAAG